MRPAVDDFLHATFADEPSDCVYVSMPITSGREYFMHLRTGGDLNDARRQMFRASNVSRALQVVDRAKREFPERRIVEPSALDEPSGWKQDDFHALWMGFISSHVTTVVMVDGWEFSTGCLWELVEALDSGARVLDERFRLLTLTDIADLVEESGLVVEDPRWTAAHNALLNRLRLMPQ